MFCPVCGNKNISNTQTGNDGALYVAEGFDNCTECYDADIDMFECINGHTFYVSKDTTK